MIDYQNILSVFVQLAREPNYNPPLSSTNNIPNVYQARPDNPELPYPSIIVDIIDTREQHSWVTNRYVNGDDSTVYETNYNITINFRCYGTSENSNASSILNQLQGYFRFSRIADEITELTGGELITVDSIESLPVLRANKYIESASFNIIFGITDSSVDSSSGVITSTSLEGEMYRHEDDPDPLPMTIIAPQ